MKYKLFFLISLCYALVGCKEATSLQEDATCPALDRLLSEQLNNDYPVCNLVFYEFSDSDFVTITPRDCYDDHLTDGYFMYNGKLVTYNFLDMKERPDIIHDKNTQSFAGTISGYPSCDEFGTYQDGPEAETYLIISPDSMVSVTDIDLSAKAEPTDSAEIRDDVFSIVSEYTKQVRSFMYDLVFREIDGKRYFVIVPSWSYDKRYVKGFFYVKSNLVVLYVSAHFSDFSQCLDMKVVQPFEGMIPHRKEAPKEDSWFLPAAWCYQIMADNTCKEVMPDSIAGWYRDPME